MRSDAEKLEEVKAIGQTMAAAVIARGPFQPADVIEAGFAMIVVMAEKLSLEPHAVMAHLLFSACNNDVARARESIECVIIARSIVGATGGRPS